MVDDRHISEIEKYICEIGSKSLLIVCGKHLLNSQFVKRLECMINKNNIAVCFFSEFTPNPKFEEVKRGIDCLIKHSCDCIISIGGGSTIDVAKCIKGYAFCKDLLCVENEIVENGIKHVVMPTTAGTGSEATSFAVIYKDYKKKSVESYCLLPDKVVFIPELLSSLPLYHRKATLFDAYCHAIESQWSINASAQSVEYSKKAIEIIHKYGLKYMDNDSVGNREMLFASNYAGRAINISKTTAGHAMSYKLTSLYGIAHGHAAAICVRAIWLFLRRKGLDSSTVFSREMKNEMNLFINMLESMNMELAPVCNCHIKELVQEVNVERLSNFPLKFEQSSIEEIYYSMSEMM